jgi:hypothetical protein
MQIQSHPRLTEQQVAQFEKEGYLRFDQPLLSLSSFEGLKTHFEEKLLRLPPDVRPESMDVPHFADTKLFEWLFADEVLDLVEPIIGPDIALFTSHFICKPRGDGRRVPWHEDFFYWKKMLSPMEVVTIWLAIDRSTRENGCMKVIPRTHDDRISEYGPVDATQNVFPQEIKHGELDPDRAVFLELEPNQCSLHDGRLAHGSDANTSSLRRCGYTMRYMSTRVKFHHDHCGAWHQIYLARGRDHSGNVYADPTKSYGEMAKYRESSGRKGH